MPDITELQYPWGQSHPDTGRLMTVKPGIHWVRMPLPFALNHINLWVLDDEQDGTAGCTVIDTGVHTPVIHDAWRSIWRGELAHQPLLRIIVTHMHPDHVGNAHWLAEQFSPSNAPARLWMSAADYLAASLAVRESAGYGGDRAARFFEAHGLSDQAGLAKIRERGGYYASMVPSLPLHYRRLQGEQEISMGGHAWRCLAGFGHAPEHIALYNAAQGVLISGDMLLPKISTNVSVLDMEPEADALGLFLDSLRAYEALPPDTLVLPSHGHPFVGIHARVRALRDHHQDRLNDILAHCRQHGPATAADLLPVLFKRPLDLHQTTFAMGEAVAHLNHLWHRGELLRQRTVDGRWQFCLT